MHGPIALLANPDRPCQHPTFTNTWSLACRWQDAHSTPHRSPTPVIGISAWPQTSQLAAACHEVRQQLLTCWGVHARANTHTRVPWHVSTSSCLHACIHMVAGYAHAMMDDLSPADMHAAASESSCAQRFNSMPSHMLAITAQEPTVTKRQSSRVGECSYGLHHTVTVP